MDTTRILLGEISLKECCKVIVEQEGSITIFSLRMLVNHDYVPFAGTNGEMELRIENFQNHMIQISDIVAWIGSPYIFQGLTQNDLCKYGRKS